MGLGMWSREIICGINIRVGSGGEDVDVDYGVFDCDRLDFTQT